jgi:hypothetical protein
MKQFICERISPDGIRIVLADGEEGGPVWADLWPVWDEDDCDLVIDTNEPDGFGLREVYQHFRRKEMTWTEWMRETQGDLIRAKLWTLEADRGSPALDEADTPPIGPIAATTVRGNETDTQAYLSLTEAAKSIPGRRPGKRASLGTIWRWCNRGLRNGIRLKSVLVGGHRCTTRQWLNEFIEVMSQASLPERHQPPVPRTPSQRQAASERAAEELKAAWERRKRPPG